MNNLEPVADRRPDLEGVRLVETLVTVSAQAVRVAVGPHAYPNRRMVDLADRALNCDGRLIAAVSAMALPDFLAPLQVAELPAGLD